MSEKKDKEERKTIKEEMAEEANQIVLTRKEDGGVRYDTKLSAPQAVHMMRSVIDGQEQRRIWYNDIELEY